jgi:hypothetical protein
VTAVNEAGTLARRAARNEWFERLTRGGLVGYGITHLLVGWIALELAFRGRAPAEGDQSGAFKALVAQPVGKWLLLGVAIGLAAMSVWQALAAVVGHLDEQGKARTFERIASGFKAVFYGYLAYKAATVRAGSAQSSGDQQQQATSTLLSEPGGRWLVGLVGLFVLGVGIGLVWYGIVKRFEKHLKTGQMPEHARKTARWLGILGYVAKGVAYGTLGVLIAWAAVSFDPSKARGLDQALRTLAAQPAGDVILVCVGAGIAAYGVFSLFQARYRKV